MAKFFGLIGYVETVETTPGVHKEVATEHNYSGDVIKNNRRLEPGENLNSNITINNSISIIADPFAYQNFHTIRYVKWMGASWKVINIDVQRPRLILTLGGVYNAQ